MELYAVSELKVGRHVSKLSDVSIVYQHDAVRKLTSSLFTVVKICRLYLEFSLQLGVSYSNKRICKAASLGDMQPPYSKIISNH